ncbi:MAG: protein-L-isoaspartate(D-aspartate) O-methyltransferase [Xanthobacteraceae bacterium]
MGGPGGDDDLPEALPRVALMLALRKRGLREPAVMRAFEQVPRDRFVEPESRPLAWADQALPISCGQTISQPSVIAWSTEALDLGPTHKVLEVGTGSGYHAALLGRIARAVVTLERFRTLAASAAERLRDLDIRNVEVVVADGALGWPAGAPYDRIVVNAAVERVPPALFEQLAENGVLVAPVGPPEAAQMLTRFARTRSGLVVRELVRVRFVPLLPGVASRL